MIGAGHQKNDLKAERRFRWAPFALGGLVQAIVRRDGRQNAERASMSVKTGGNGFVWGHLQF
jgi:hypothetical protein